MHVFSRWFKETSLSILHDTSHWTRTNESPPERKHHNQNWCGTVFSKIFYRDFSCAAKGIFWHLILILLSSMCNRMCSLLWLSILTFYKKINTSGMLKGTDYPKLFFICWKVCSSEFCFFKTLPIPSYIVDCAQSLNLRPALVHVKWSTHNQPGKVKIVNKH